MLSGEDADQVDHGVGAGHRPVDRGAVAQVGLHRHDLADAAERLQMGGEVGPAAGGADAPAVPRQGAHDVAAEEAGGAEHGDDRLLFSNEGHDTLPKHGLRRPACHQRAGKSELLRQDAAFCTDRTA